MSTVKVELVMQYVEENIAIFHQKRLESLDRLRLKTVLRKKNPYLFRAKNLLTAEEVIKGLTEAYLSSSEEGIFGDWLEGLAVYINKTSYSGWKSGIPGVDLEFDNKGRRYIVTIKSGPNWGNSSQIQKMRHDFKQAARTLRTSNSKLHVVPINGCCYGKDNHPDKGDYYKYCGQRFWSFISGSQSLYTDIIEPLGHKAKERNDEFNSMYSQMVNRFVREFTCDFCLQNGAINWEKLVSYNSGK